MTIETLKMAMADPKIKATEMANGLGITTTTRYAYVNGGGSIERWAASIGQFQRQVNGNLLDHKPWL